MIDSNHLAHIAQQTAIERHMHDQIIGPIADQARIQDELHELKLELNVLLKRKELLEQLIALKETLIVPF